MAQQNSELEQVCGLFRNQSKKGDTYYSGKNQETGEEYVMFKNSYWKDGDNKPYFRLQKRSKSNED